MAALTFGTSDFPAADPRRGALLRLLDTMAEWQMRHSHHVISRSQPACATRQRREPAVERKRALEHQPLRPVGAQRRIGLVFKTPDSTTRAFGSSCRAIGAASRCSGRSRMFDITRSNGARLAISGACRSAAWIAVTNAPTPFSLALSRATCDRARVDVGGEHRHAEQLRRGDRENPRTGAEIENVTRPVVAREIIQRQQAAARGAVVAGAERGRRPRSRGPGNAPARGRGRARRARQSGRR